MRKNKILFTDATSALENNVPSFSYGVTIFDIDGDGDPEILVSNTMSDNIIYKYQESTQSFVDVAPKNFKSAQYATLNMCVGDFLGNGSSSVYVLHADTFSGPKTHYDQIFTRTSKAGESLVFENILSKNPNMSNPYSGRSVGAVDYEGNGKHSFFVANYQAPSLFYSFNGKKNSVEELSRELGLRQISGGRSVLAQYITNQNALDIFVGNENASNSLFTKLPSGKYKEVALEHDLDDTFFDSRGVAIADFDGNGLADLVLGTWDGINSIFMQKEKGQFKNLPPAVFSEPRHIRSVIVADFDNDGNEEIFINNFGQRNRMFRYLDNNEWEELSIGNLASKNLYGTGAAVGDLTGNGFLDIFIANGEKYETHNNLFLGIPNKNHWLRLQPLTQNGFPALGAKVQLFCKNGKNQTKYICSGSGYLCQMEPVAHFGLGSTVPNIDRIEVTWPGDGKSNPAFRSIDGKFIGYDQFVQIPHPLSRN